MSASKLITDHLDLWTGAVTSRSTAGRGRNGKIELTGIKKLRELILELAVRGKLVEQDPSDEPASMLLERIAEEKARLVKEGKIKKPKKLPEITEDEKPFELPDGWTWARLGNITAKIGSGATPRGGKNAYTETGIPFLRSQNIWNEGLSLEDVAYIPPETHEKMANTHVSPNDILLNITGASLGRCTLVPDSLPEANVSQHVTIIRTTESANRAYLHATILSPYIQGLVWGRQVGMAREGLSKKVLELFEIPIPPVVEQHRIVERVDELMALCDRLEQQVGDQLDAHEVLVDTLLDALTRSADAAEVAENWARIAEHFDILFTTEASIEKLKQAILQLAVMGRLVEQDPSDEPASILLERIAEEKARLVKEGKIKKSKKQPEISEEEKPFDLPEGWAWARLGNITSKIGSGATPRGGKNAYTEAGIPFLRSQNIWNDGLSLEDVAYIPESTHEKMGNTHVCPNDILLNITGASLGRCTVVPESLAEANVSQHVTIVRTTDPSNRYYLHAAILSPYVQGLVWERQVGMAREGLSKKVLELFEIPLPPEAEQLRIVEKIDELMTLCDQLNEKIKASSNVKLLLADAVLSNLLVEEEADRSETAFPSLSEIKIQELSEIILKEINIENFITRPIEKKYKEKITHEYTYDSLDLMIRGEHGDKGVEYLKLPGLLNAVSQSMNNTLVGDVVGTLGLPATFIKLSLALLRKIFGESVKLDQWYALILMAFPEKDERSAKELIERVNKKCRAAGVSGLDEAELSARISHLTDLRIITPHPQLNGVWKLTQRYKRSDYSS